MIQVSADVDTVIDPLRVDAEDKLAGLQVGHFGAFFKEAWRVNDWMWGRLDGSARIVDILLQPKRLRQLGRTPDDVVNALIQVRYLAATREEWEADVRQELDFLRSSDARALRTISAPPVPQSLPVVSKLLTEAIQLDIACEEIPDVADAINRDEEEGSPPSRDAARFRDAVKAAGAITPSNVRRLVAACGVGKEKIFFGEVRSARFLEDASTAAAVTTATLAAPTSGFGFARGVTSALRSATLGVWAVVRAARLGGPGAIVMVTLMALAGALLAIEISREANVPSALLWVALGILAAGVGTATVRALPNRGTALGTTLAIVLIVGVAACVQIGLDGEGWVAVLRPVLTVGVLVGGLAALPYVRDALLEQPREMVMKSLALTLGIGLALASVLVPDRFADDFGWDIRVVVGMRIAGVLILGMVIGWLLRRREKREEDTASPAAP